MQDTKPRENMRDDQKANIRLFFLAIPNKDFSGENESSNPASVIGPIVAVIIILVIAVVLLTVYVRRRRRNVPHTGVKRE